VKKFCAFIFAGLASGCLPTQTPNQIIVDGEATLEFEPEVFSLSATIRSRSDSQAEVLANIAERLDGIRETLPALDGLTNLEIDASEAEIEPMLDRQCVSEADYRMEDQCPVIAHFGSINLSVKGAPADKSGDSMSALSELGAERVALVRYSLVDMEAAQKKAIEAAMRSARLNADQIATAAGAVLVGPVRIQYGEGFAKSGYASRAFSIDAAEIDTRGATTVYSPKTNLDLQPQTIEVEAKIVAAFEIE